MQIFWLSTLTSFVLPARPWRYHDQTTCWKISSGWWKSLRWGSHPEEKKKGEDFQGNVPEFWIWRVLDRAISDWEDKLIAAPPAYVVCTRTTEQGNWPSLTGSHILTAGGLQGLQNCLKKKTFMEVSQPSTATCKNDGAPAYVTVGY